MNTHSNQEVPRNITEESLRNAIKEIGVLSFGYSDREVLMFMRGRREGIQLCAEYICPLLNKNRRIKHGSQIRSIQKGK